MSQETFRANPLKSLEPEYGKAHLTGSIPLLLNEGMRGPFIIGIAGGTGSGKTSLASRLFEKLGKENTEVLQQDDYYLDSSLLSLEERSALNFDHPDALDVNLLTRQLDRLSSGEEIETPIYDFQTHTRSRKIRRVYPRKVLLLEGTLIFAVQEIRKRIDLCIFVDADHEIRLARRLQRDMQERGRTRKSVLNQYRSTVKPMHEEFVQPSARFADFVLRSDRAAKVSEEILVWGLRQYLGLEI